MNIGFSTNAFTNKTIFSAIDTISEIGYDGIELVVDTPHAFLPLKKDDILKIKNRLKQKNLQVSNLNSNTFYISKNDFQYYIQNLL